MLGGFCVTDDWGSFSVGIASSFWLLSDAICTADLLQTLFGIAANIIAVDVCFASLSHIYIYIYVYMEHFLTYL